MPGDHDPLIPFPFFDLGPLSQLGVQCGACFGPTTAAAPPLGKRKGERERKALDEGIPWSLLREVGP